MGLFGPSKTTEEKMKDFEDNGVKCEAIIGTAGRSGAFRAGATLALGIIGFAASTGKVDKKAQGKLYKKEKGLRFIPKKDQYMEIRIPWENITHVGVEEGGQLGLYIYTDNDDCVIFTLQGYEKRNFLSNIIEDKCNLLKDDLEGWE